MPELILNIDNLREYLSSTTMVRENAFLLAQSLCAIEKTIEESAFQEILLRALEHREEFGESKKIIDSLVREVGLFPFLKPEDLCLADQIAYEYHRPQNMPSTVFHRPQARVYRELLNRRNVVLSAPTSFGKSLVIDALILSGKYNNFLVIVPTIALIDETRRRLSKLTADYKIITHRLQKPADKNVYVLTQERVFEGVNLDKIDLFVIDEFYKLSPTGEDDTRSELLNKAFYILNKKGKQFYMLGPNISHLSPEFESNIEYVFIRELYQTVASETTQVQKRGSDFQTLIALCKEIKGQTIIFCQSPNRTSVVANSFIENNISRRSQKLNDAIDWVSKEFHPDWHFVKSLSSGIGIHHAKIPRALAQFVLRSFDKELVKYLICTSTLIEGVNTKARNIIIFDNKIASKKFDFFTFNNIKGRSGRMFKHFVGRVYLFHPPPTTSLPSVDAPIFSQTDQTSESLLIQIDEEDLSPKSKQRLEDYKEQTSLPYSILKENITINLEAQLKLAKTLESSKEYYYSKMNWSQLPNKKELDIICSLIWDFFNGEQLGARKISSAQGLSNKIFQVMKHQNLKVLIDLEINTGVNPDEAVQNVLEFMRSWLTFHLPKFIRAINRIQKYVFGRTYLDYGDFDYFAEKLEHFFIDPAIFALDEYGIPFQLGKKLEPYLQPNGNLDIALQNLKNLDVSNLDLHPFEIELIKDTQNSLPSYITSNSLF
jgi:superfamily II DNA/RNA helicase